MHVESLWKPYEPTTILEALPEYSRSILYSLPTFDRRESENHPANNEPTIPPTSRLLT